MHQRAERVAVAGSVCFAVFLSPSRQLLGEYRDQNMNTSSYFVSTSSITEPFGAIK
jgi:hypothetical protein